VATLSDSIEALAEHLAWEAVHDHVAGEHWFGWPDPDDDEQMRESFEVDLPYAREKAKRYLRVAGLLAEEAED
jgi:hypothetical protein